MWFWSLVEWSYFSIFDKHGKFRDYNDEKDYPTPYEENLSRYYEQNILKYFGDYRCGVLNINLFFHWFPEIYLKYFEEKGSFISCYEVHPENIRIGSKQVIFRQDRSKILDKRKPTQWEYLMKY